MCVVLSYCRYRHSLSDTYYVCRYHARERERESFNLLTSNTICSYKDYPEITKKEEEKKEAGKEEAGKEGDGKEEGGMEETDSKKSQ